MRIVAGEYRGRSIAAPEGDGTRPTIDRVRESLFSMLFSRLGGFSDCVALDAFAGSGALGLEALSRGAASVWFYERDPKAARVVERNIAQFGLASPRAVLRRADVLDSPPLRPARKFSLVLLDPPYATDPEEIFTLIDRLLSASALTPDVVVCYEHAKKTDLAPYVERHADRWEEITTRKYGKVMVTLLTPRQQA